MGYRDEPIESVIQRKEDRIRALEEQLSFYQLHLPWLKSLWSWYEWFKDNYSMFKTLGLVVLGMYVTHLMIITNPLEHPNIPTPEVVMDAQVSFDAAQEEYGVPNTPFHRRHIILIIVVNRAIIERRQCLVYQKQLPLAWQMQGRIPICYPLCR